MQEVLPRCGKGVPLVLFRLEVLLNVEEVLGTIVGDEPSQQFKHASVFTYGLETIYLAYCFLISLTRFCHVTLTAYIDYMTIYLSILIM